MKHKHADLIHAWADGAEIEYFNVELNSWIDVSAMPLWDEKSQYRIKPEEKNPVVRWLWVFSYNGDWLPTTRFYSESEADKQGFTIKLEWSRTEFPE